MGPNGVLAPGASPLPFPVPIEAEHIYGGTFLFYDSSGYGTATSGANAFAGLTLAGKDNSAGSAGAVTVGVFQAGIFELPLFGATQADVGKLVYSSDNYTLTETAGSNPKIGRIVGFVSAGIVKVSIGIL